MQNLVPTSRFVLFALVGMSLPRTGLAQPPARPYKVQIIGEKDKIAERVLPADPKIRIAYQYVGNMGFGVSAEGKRLTPGPGSIQTHFMIDGNVQSPKIGKKLEPLPEGPAHKKRSGGQTVWDQGDLRVTMTLEVVPGKPSQPRPGEPIARRMDTLLVKYSIENVSAVPHKVGARTFIDTMIADNDGALFASPTTHPKQLLDGLQLENKGMPSFIEVLQRPSLQQPGFKGILTFKLGDKLEGPGKLVLTRYGVGFVRYVVPPLPSGGDSACALYWEPRELPPQSRRELAFAYGQGIAHSNSGRISADFAGSFAPGKAFTITAYVDGPTDGQSLTLQLPKGIDRIDGKATQVVPSASETGQNLVMWRCRLAQLGTYPIQIRSNNGVTRTWTVKVAE